jgi:hypothetical protein
MTTPSEQSDRIGTVLVISTWVLALAPIAGVLVGFSMHSNRPWFYLPAAAHWLCTASTGVIAAVLKSRSAGGGKQIAAWAGVVVALLGSIELSTMDSL